MWEQLLLLSAMLWIHLAQKLHTHPQQREVPVPQRFVLNHCAWFVRQEKESKQRQGWKRTVMETRDSAAFWSSFKAMSFISKAILCSVLTNRIWVYMLHPNSQAVFAVLMSLLGCPSSDLLRQNCWDDRKKNQPSFLRAEEKQDS